VSTRSRTGKSMAECPPPKPSSIPSVRDALGRGHVDQKVGNRRWVFDPSERIARGRGLTALDRRMLSPSGVKKWLACGGFVPISGDRATAQVDGSAQAQTLGHFFYLT